MSEYDNDRLYLDLLGARENLCRAQTHVPQHWRSGLQVALDHIDEAGSSLCPIVWSRFDQPRTDYTESTEVQVLKSLLAEVLACIDEDDYWALTEMFPRIKDAADDAR